jgi:hypothetical protein
MKKTTLTENKAEQNPNGGVLVGKRKGQTIIHNKGTLSGYLVGRTHDEGGIQAVNKSTGQPLEMQGGEVVITAPAVSDQTKNEFNGKMMTNREILSQINVNGGGVSFAKGGDIPKNIKRTGASYKYGGKLMTDHEIYRHITKRQKQNLIKDSKRGNSPARDLNNYNDVLDLQADGAVGAETGLFAKGGLVENATVDNWNDIPDSLKSIRLPKKVNYDETPSDDGLNEIVKSFLSNDSLREAMTGINFDDNGITATNAHILLTLPTLNKNYKGIYKKTQTGVEVINNTFPNYSIVIPKIQDLTKVVEIDVLKLLTYCKVARNYSGKTDAIVFKIHNTEIEFFPDVIIDFLNSLVKLGWQTCYVGFQTNKKGLIFTKYRDYKFGEDEIALIMPYIYGNNNSFGAKNLDKNTQLFVYFDFDDNEIHNADGSIVYLKNQPKIPRAKRSVKATPSQSNVPTNKVLTRDELRNKKIWIGDDLPLLNKVIDKLKSMGVPYDAVHGAKNPTNSIYIETYSSDFVVWKSNKKYFDKLKVKEIFPSDLGINTSNVSSSTLGTTPILVSELTLEDLSDSKIEVNPSLSEKIQLRAFELGLRWVDGTTTVTEIDAPYLIFNGSVNQSKSRIEYRTNPSDFKKVNLKQIFVTDVMPTSAPTTSSQSSKQTAPFDFTDTKIWIGDNPDLSRMVQQKAIELGFDWWGGNKQVQNLNFKSLFFDINEKITSTENKFTFDTFKDYKEIFASDLFPNAPTQTTSSQTSTQNAPFDLDRKWIFVGGNIELAKYVLERAIELGITDFSAIKRKINDNDAIEVIWFKDKYIGWGDNSFSNNNKDFEEIYESDLFPIASTQTTSNQTSTQNAPVNEDWSKKFTADLDKLIFGQSNSELQKAITLDVVENAPQISKDQRDLDNLKKLLPQFQAKKYAIERAKILKEIKKLDYKLTYEGFIKPNEAMSTDASLFTPQGLLDYYFTQSTQNPTAELEPACELPTPNGEKSKLPLSAYLNVRTPQFKKWFGDWEKAYETGNYVNCSKMIDPDTKEPKIYFHGVRKYVPNFGQFSNMGQGVVRPYGTFEPPTFPASYFAGEEDYAKFYGGIAENLPTPSPDYKPFIYKVFLSVKNPISLLPLDFMLSYKDFMDYVFVAYGVKVTPNQELLKILGNDIKKKNPMWIYVRRDIGFIEMLKDYGYDALFQIGDIPTFLPNGEVEPDRTKYLQEVEYLTFYPNQVKSATVKKSFYFDFFNDIRFKNGGYVGI